MRNLIGNIDYNNFIEYHFEKMFLVSYEENPDFKNLISKDDISNLIQFYNLGKGDVRLVKKEKIIPFGEYGRNVRGNLVINPEIVHQHIRKGATLVVNDIGRFFKSILTMQSSLSNHLLSRIQVNAYFTPIDSFGFGHHYDGHDVIIIQQHGLKCWEIFKSRMDKNVSKHGDFKKAIGSEYLHLKETIKATPGNIIYIPSGLVHKAWTEEESSLHISIGIHPINREDILQKFVEDFCQKYYRNSSSLSKLTLNNENDNFITEFKDFIDINWNDYVVTSINDLKTEFKAKNKSYFL
jgi:ribosomal protein L16 Arg81 hydroxylase